MKEINVKEFGQNVFELIGKEWMLVTAGNKDKFNTMTASWGGMGVLWGKPVVFVFVRPERYTFEFMEANDTFTLSFLGFEDRKIYNICGSKSGRVTDKVKETGLRPYFTEGGNVLFEQSRLSLECKKLYAENLNPACFLQQEALQKWYGDAQGGMHKMYIAEIRKVLIND